jgi:RNA polymerase sigma-70 factor (ECF subfamily)
MQTAEEEILLHHLDALYRYAMALSRNPDSASDLVQETYLRAATARHKLRVDSNVKSWLFTILRNLWLNQLRKARLAPEEFDFDLDERLPHGGDEYSSNPHGIYVKKMQVERMREAVSRLPSHFREIVILREYEELSYQEISTILQCPIGTVMSRLARARSRLRSVFLQVQEGGNVKRRRSSPGIEAIWPTHLVERSFRCC